MRDVVVIGGGPAGLSAALYAKWIGLDVVLFSPVAGGTLQEIPIIKNYPGFSGKGEELAAKMTEQIQELKVPIKMEEVDRVEKKDHSFLVRGLIEEEDTYALIFATGSNKRRLNVPGENLKGVSYCATCDAPFAKDKKVAVIGGGNSAFIEAIHLSEWASDVTIIHRRETFRADKSLIDEAVEKGIHFLKNKRVKEILGETEVKGLLFEDGDTFDADFVLIAIGLNPSSEIAHQDLGVNVDERGFIKVDRETMATSVPGVYAAGDVTNFWPKQVVVATAQGAVAALSARDYINALKKSI